MILPSEALNRKFVLDKAALSQPVLDSEFDTITTHAVLVGDIGLLLPVGEVSELVEHLPVEAVVGHGQQGLDLPVRIVGLVGETAAAVVHVRAQ